MDYTILGKHVNLASRIEAQATPNSILISQSTYSLIHKDIECQSKGAMKLKGVERPIHVYEVMRVFNQ